MSPHRVIVEAQAELRRNCVRCSFELAFDESSRWRSDPSATFAIGWVSSPSMLAYPNRIRTRIPQPGELGFFNEVESFSNAQCSRNHLDER